MNAAQRLTSRLLLSLLCLTPAGCNVIGAGTVVSQKLFGNGPVDPVFVLGPDPTLVLVENFRNPVGAMSDSEEVTQFIVQSIRDNLKAKKDEPAKVNIIDPEKVLEFQNSPHSNFAKLKIPEVGAALGAKQVIYVDLMMSGVDFTPGSEMLRGKFTATVRVVDVGTGQTLWPNEVPDGMPVTWESKPQRPSDTVYPAAVRERALRIGSDHIARLFFKWKPADFADDDELQAVPSL